MGIIQSKKSYLKKTPRVKNITTGIVFIVFFSKILKIWSKTNDIRKELDYDERLNILGLMWEIVLVDDILDVFEAQLMRRVSGLLYISDVDSGNSKKRAYEAKSK